MDALLKSLPKNCVPLNTIGLSNVISARSSGVDRIVPPIGGTKSGSENGFPMIVDWSEIPKGCDEALIDSFFHGIGIGMCLLG